ncbi:hypothetical protein [Pseudonocardia sp. N23]|nr:hypothetical protein [Pseudonocardia sp. N23]GAY11624.1 hypothetical protein TOK_0004 [Pseudonocardia sp. N23]
MARPSAAKAVAVIEAEAFVILDGTLLRIDRVRKDPGRDRHSC